MNAKRVCNVKRAPTSPFTTMQIDKLQEKLWINYEKLKFKVWFLIIFNYQKLLTELSVPLQPEQQPCPTNPSCSWFSSVFETLPALHCTSQEYQSFKTVWTKNKSNVKLLDTSFRAHKLTRPEICWDCSKDWVLFGTTIPTSTFKSPAVMQYLFDAPGEWSHTW